MKSILGNQVREEINKYMLADGKRGMASFEIALSEFAPTIGL